MKLRYSNLIALIFFSIDLFSFQLHAEDIPWRADFEKYLDQLMQDYAIPGLAIEVVNENGPILQITKGYRNIAEKLPVTSETLYSIGSTTKAFTGALIAQLKDQNQLNFDDPVQKYLPDFKIKTEPKIPLSLRDLMGHWTGVGRHDLAWWHRRNLTRKDLFALIPSLEVTAPPRTMFIYNNWMWMTTGLVAESITKKSWEELIQERIFMPLGMQASNTSTDESQKVKDFSLPYESDGKTVTQIPFFDVGGMRPAGGINSNLNDMAKWIQLHLNHGRVGEKQIISEEALNETYKPYSKQSEKVDYGMGWVILKFFDKGLLTHDGGIDGFSSNVSIMPNEKLGVVVLMNSTRVKPQTIAFRLWQLVNGNSNPKDWTRDASKVEAEANKEAAKKWPDPLMIYSSRPLSEYAGKYCHPAYGELEVSVVKDALHLKLPSIEMYFGAYGPDLFFSPGVFSQIKNIAFFPNDGGKISGLKWALEVSSSTPIEFQRCTMR